MEIKRYDNLFFPRNLGKTFTVKEKFIVINELITNNLWRTGNFKEKQQTNGTTQVRRKGPNRGPLLAERRKSGRTIRRLTGDRKKR